MKEFSDHFEKQIKLQMVVGQRASLRDRHSKSEFNNLIERENLHL